MTKFRVSKDYLKPGIHGSSKSVAWGHDTLE